jgi:hypothetical protein
MMQGALQEYELGDLSISEAPEFGKAQSAVD